MSGEFLYTDDLDLMIATIEELWNKFRKWKEAFENKGLKVNLEKTKVVVNGCITKDGLFKVYPCGICSLRVKVT